MPTSHNIASLLWEVALESARQAFAPEKVSRLCCVFTCETLDDALAFREQFRNDAAILIVEPVLPDTNFHRGSFILKPPMGSAPAYVDYMSEVAVRYWTEEPASCIEVLVSGSVRIVDHIR